MITPNWKRLLRQTAEAAISHLEGLDERPVAAPASAEDLLASIGGPLPHGPSAPEKVIGDLVAAADQGLAAMPSGRWFGYVIGGALPAALAADWLTSTWDQNAAMSEPTPAAMVVEQVAARWLLELLQLPEHASIGFVTGCQMAHVTCLAAARDAVLRAEGWDVEADGLQAAPRVRVVLGADAHDTVARSLRLLGLGATHRVVATDDQGRMRPEALADALAGGAEPTVVCAQIGNVNTGAVDPLDALADVVDEQRGQRPDTIWLHVDGAFGLWAAASPTRGRLLRGVQRADSWATDAHKWLNVPYDSGIAICARPDAHRRAMSVHASYLPTPAGAGRDALDWTPEFSRRARGFAIYAALRELGRIGAADLVDRCCDLAERFAVTLSVVDGVEIVNQVVLNQVLVRFRDPLGVDDDGHTRAVLERVRRNGTCFMSGTTWRGAACMRISVSNWSTTPEDVDTSVAVLVAAHRSTGAR